MAEYYVMFERRVTEEGCITVEADSAEEAGKKAKQDPKGPWAWDRKNTSKSKVVSVEKLD